jgi:tripartite-type tricarboxylate transporter receptor subunit TctC
VLAPGGTPAPILERLQKLIAEGMRTPEMQARLKTEGAEAVVNTPDQFKKVIDSEIDRWTKLAKVINLQPQ